MQQTDLLRRRQQVSQMPPQIFQPLYKRQEVREDLQREMEFAFEDMYTGERSEEAQPMIKMKVQTFLLLDFVWSQGSKVTWWSSWFLSLFQICPVAARTKSWMLLWRKTGRVMLKRGVRALSRRLLLKVKQKQQRQTFHITEAH